MNNDIAPYICLMSLDREQVQGRGTSILNTAKDPVLFKLFLPGGITD